MKKTFRILFLPALFILLFISVFFLIIRFKTESPETTLVKTFKSSGAGIVSSEIYFRSKLDDKYCDMDDLKLLVKDFSNSLNIVENGTSSNKVTRNDFIQKVEFNGISGKNELVNICVQFINKETDGTNGGYVTVSIIDDLTDKELEKTRQTVLKIFKKHKINPRISSCITGNYAGKLGYEQLNGICGRMLKEVNAEKVEGMREGNLISISAYSPLINNCVIVNKKKVNLNLAVRYNSYEDKTYIWLGTPVITTEY